MQTVVIPNKCNNCQSWTATRISHDGSTALIECTVCAATISANWTAGQTGTFVRNVRKFVKVASAAYPQLAGLSTPGASAVLPLEGSEKYSHLAK